ncbi:hypothetical protein BGX33_011209 [Mortierella sp. NVP41]|nr:hypothetical protein BGX33_011209 [Mortierella sp. NVP41]
MESACMKVLAIPEVAQAVASNLTPKQLSPPMLTSRQMHALCTPSFFRTLPRRTERGHSPQHLPDALATFARNVRHIRELNAYSAFAVEYYNTLAGDYYSSLWDYQINDKDEDENSIAPGTHLALLTWLPTPDPRHQLPIPFPPMTNLTKLDFDMGRDTRITTKGGDKCVVNEHVYLSLLQACGIIRLNPNMVDLSLENIPIKTEGNIQVLASVINGLQKLQLLSLVFDEPGNKWRRLFHTLFWACPPALEKFEFQQNDDDLDNDSEEDDDLEGDMEQGNEGDEGDESWDSHRADGTMEGVLWTRRQEPLTKLTALYTGEMRFLNQEELEAIFEQCPALEVLEMPHIERSVDNLALGRFIGQSSPNLKLLQRGSIEFGQEGHMITGIMSTLPEHRLERLMYYGFYEYAAYKGRMGAAIQRYSLSLREIKITESERLLSKTIQTILRECSVLEVFNIHDRYPRAHNIGLADAVEFEWACKGIKELWLAVAIGKGGEQDSSDFDDSGERASGSGFDAGPTNDQDSAVDDNDKEHGDVGTNDVFNVSTYARDMFALLSEPERRRRFLLDKFYRQLAKLTNLEVLSLDAIHEDIDINDDSVLSWNQYQKCRETLLPAMLSLGDASKLQTGYLGLFKGWKLKSLHGSFNLHSEEAYLTIDQPEMEFICANWPLLRSIDFEVV